ncbi:MAG: hypothetical protein IJR82_03925 [Bacilli bacterium]|nr:hypothetical protein [Bacilli bacterium]
MTFREIPKGNNQKIYMNEMCLNFSYSSFFYTASLMNYLQNMGYELVFDDELASEDTFFFMPCTDEKINITSEIFKLKKARKILDILYENNIVKPYTAQLDDRLFDIIDVPFVIKNEAEHGGNGKYLIKNSDQLNKFNYFYHQFSTYYNQEMSKYKECHPNKDISYLSANEFKKILHEKFVIQEYIQTPTSYNTSLRVLTSLSGDVLCSSLKYFNPDVKINSNNHDIISSLLLDKSSPFYLGVESVISNTVAGGSSILLGENNYNDLEKQILIAHNIDPYNSKIPSNVEKAALDIACRCSREIGAICGIDFIYSEEDHKWYYLEEHEFPMLSSYCAQYNLPYKFSTQNHEQFLLECQLADIDARLNSLSMYMKKKVKR